MAWGSCVLVSFRCRPAAFVAWRGAGEMLICYVAQIYPLHIVASSSMWMSLFIHKQWGRILRKTFVRRLLVGERSFVVLILLFLFSEWFFVFNPLQTLHDCFFLFIHFVYVFVLWGSLVLGLIFEVDLGARDRSRGTCHPKLFDYGTMHVSYTVRKGENGEAVPANDSCWPVTDLWWTAPAAVAVAVEASCGFRDSEW